MKSRITIAGHPVHSMIVPFPIVLYTITFASLIAYKISLVNFWFQIGYVANFLGILFAVLAGLVGYTDWALAIPKLNHAKETGRVHMTYNVLGSVFFILSAWACSSIWNDTQPNVNTAVILSALGLFCTYTAILYGWNLVQRHHVGINMTTEQENIEPSEPEKYFAPHVKTQVR